ncbi:MAG: methyltransferase domain-containing protein [Firmicutes bacterium]|nr:methyltransferase domain-containing protein [Bacillota bacterium]
MPTGDGQGERSRHGYGGRHEHGHGAFDPEHLRRHEAERRAWMAPEALLGEMLAGDGAGGVLVDVGAGTGFFALAAARHLPFARVVAVDRQADMVAHVRERARGEGLGNVEAVQGEAEALPLADGSADAALFSMVLHDISRPERALAEAARVLRPGGRLLLVELRPGATDKGPPPEILFEPHRLDALVEGSGYAINRRWHGPGPLYRLKARRSGAEGDAVGKA